MLVDVKRGRDDCGPRMLQNQLNRIKVAPCSFWLQCLNEHEVERLVNCPGTC